VIGLAVALLDDEAGRAAQAEINRKGEPHRAAADDQDGTVDGWIRR
jgi:hypothetical protein